MTQLEISEIVQSQRKFFRTNATLPVNFRIDALRKLHNAIKSNEEKIAKAIKSDLGKSAMESYMCETGLTLSEIS